MSIPPLDQRREAVDEAEVRAVRDRERDDVDRSPSERLEATLRLSATLTELSRAPRRDV